MTTPYTKPQCFETAEQFMEWRRANVGTKEKAIVCEDCTPGHKRRMLDLKRCDSAVWERIALGPHMQFRIQEAAL
jgi:hypothetical protein